MFLINDAIMNPMEKRPYRLPRFLVIGACGRNSGKTTFSEEVIRNSSLPLTAVKITIIRDEGKGCPLGGEGCGICSSLQGDFELTEETVRDSGKDTSRLLAAGAQRVLWLRVRSTEVRKGLDELLSRLSGEEPVLCESNGIMNHIEPGLFLLLKARGDERIKKSARTVMDRADLLIETLPEGALFDVKRLDYGPYGWKLTTSLP